MSQESPLPVDPLDALVANEGAPDVVQISGGEPTLHPELFAILAAAKRRPIRHLMLNTNGVRIARDSGFARELARMQPGFEVYLQFDSLRDDARSRPRRDAPGPRRTRPPMCRAGRRAGSCVRD